jgi:hypothetical protein
MPKEHYELIDSIYDPSEEELQFVDVPIHLSTMLVDRVNQACRKTNLDPNSFYSVAIVRALIDYEQYSNSI